MTRLPHESWNVSAVDGGPAYKVGPKCSNPFCDRWADHAHHIWRRSFVVGDVKWVTLNFEEPAVVVQNLCGLCHACHEVVTLNESAILWQDGRFVWQETPDSYDWAASPLDPQPLTLAEFQARLVAAGDSPVSDPHGEHGSDEVCPTCHRTKRKPVKLAPGEKRKRKTWPLTVPDDAEDGASILDELVEQLAERWGMGDYSSKLKRYFVVIAALVACLTNNITIEEG